MMNEEENIGNGDPDSGLGSVTSNHAYVPHLLAIIRGSNEALFFSLHCPKFDCAFLYGCDFINFLVAAIFYH